MKYCLFCSAVLLMTGPALAQETSAPAGQETTQPSQAMPEPSQQQPSSTVNVAAVVDSEFPSYDSDKSGDLNQAEFSNWMTTLKKAEVASTGQALGDNEIAAWAGAAFTMADKDKSHAVSKVELVSYLGG